MSMPDTIIVLRRPEENRVAIVRITSRCTDHNELMSRLSNAVTRWIDLTMEGKCEWARTGGDLNIADLETIVESPNSDGYESFLPFLEQEGLFDVHIDLFGSDDCPSDYTYDTVLYVGEL